MRTITTRLDDDAETALNNLVTAAGTDQSKMLRTLILAAERERVLTQAQAEAQALRDDPAYQAEIAALADQMEPISAW